MGIKYSFIDNTLYGPEDINDITKSLTGAGVAPFASKDSYDASDLNGLTSALVEAGASLDGCECCIENAGTAEMTVAVSQGIVFFESGVRLTVDEAGYIIPVTPNTKGYVYAHYSPSLQKADIVFATELPTDGEVVLLAEISASGTVADKRIFARSKVATMGKNVTLTPSFAATEPEFLEINNSDRRWYIVAKAPAVDLSRFNYALVYSPKSARYEMLNLASDGTVYLEDMYTYGPTNYAQVVNNRLCVIQDTTETGGYPYTPSSFNDRLLRYKIIFV